MIVDTFVYAGNDDRGTDDAHDGDAINSSAAALDTFVDGVIAKAIQLRSSDRLAHQSYPRAALVTGDKGIGKTHLQNFILSKYSQRFDKDNLLWIRLNLVRDFGEDDTPDMNAWVRAQIAKVLCRYYDPKSSHCSQNRPSLDIDFRFLLSKFISDARWDANEKRVMRDQMYAMLSKLQDPNKDQDIQPSWLSGRFGDEIFSIAREKGLAFVVVFDGLDLLTRSETQKHKLETRLNAVSKYLSQETVLPLYHLLFVREETLVLYPEFLESFRAAAYSNSEVGEHRVAPIHPKHLLESRVRFANSHSITGQDDIVDGFERADEFLAFLQTTDSGLLSNRGQPLTYLEAISELSGASARSATQLLYAAATYFSADVQEYQLTELAMMGTKAFPPSMYQYRRRGDALVAVRAHLDARTHDTIFLPSIVAFPFDEQRPARDTFASAGLGTYLIGVRVLQAVRWFAFNNRAFLPVKDALSLMERVYGYEYAMTFAGIQAWCDVELLQLRAFRGLQATDYVEQSAIEITSKGRVILEKYLPDATYLGVAAFAMPMPSIAFPDPSEQAGTGLVRARAYSQDGLQEWVTAKLVNAFTVGRLLVAANAEHRDSLRERARQLSKDYPWRDHGVAALEAELLNEDSDVYSIGVSIDRSLPEIAHRIVGSLGERGPAVLRDLADIAEGILAKTSQLSM